jgi:hypothetical protein
VIECSVVPMNTLLFDGSLCVLLIKKTALRHCFYDVAWTHLRPT